MLPIKLTMAGFCSYMDTTVINFEDLGESGVYLITGDTGAGKTTIFDAISYALYGEANGDDREVKMLRNQAATPDTPTFVELEFKNKGKTYTIKRNPEYVRNKQKGSGTAIQKASVTLTMPDKITCYIKEKEVKDEIINILGIDKNQFSQIAMIPQGEFQRLIKAETKDRLEIFRRIFNTGKYQELQKKLSENTKELSNQISNITNNIDENISALSLYDNQILSSTLTLEEKILKIQEIIELDKEYEQNHNQKHKDLTNQSTNISQELGQLKEQAKAFESLKQSTNKKIQLEKDLLDLEKLLKVEQDKEPTRELTKISIKKAETDMPKYEKLQETKNSLINEISTKTNNINSLDKHQKDLDIITKSLDTKKQQCQDLKNTPIDLNNAKTKLEKLSQKQNSIMECFTLITIFEKIDPTLETSALDKLKANYNDINVKYEQVFNSYINSQAGFLAMDLKENSPCLVCGSTTHPKKAVLEKSASTEEDVNNIKAKREKAELAVLNQSKKVQEIISDISSKENEIRKTASKILLNEFDDFTNINIIKDTLTLEKSNLDSDISNVNSNIINFNKLVETFNNLEIDIPKIEIDIKTFIDNISSLKNRISINETEIKNYEKVILEIGELDFDSLQKAQEHLTNLNNQLQGLENALKNAIDDLGDKKLEINSVIGEITSSEKLLENVDTNVNLIEIHKNKSDKLQEIKDELNNINEIIKGIGIKIVNNSNVLNNINIYKKNMAIAKTKYDNIYPLSVAVNGKTKLETYVQMTFFDIIISKANLRYFEMSNGRYKLIRQKPPLKSQGQTGLDLEVIDFSNNKQRSVKSLSGGESFMASISLALGLSDVIQSNAGGIELGSLFIDEGFGTLDIDTLRCAIKILQKLSENGKIIGMISHVDDLKERIDKQIIVKKSTLDGVLVSNATIQV